MGVAERSSIIILSRPLRDFARMRRSPRRLDAVEDAASVSYPPAAPYGFAVADADVAGLLRTDRSE
jgi:hypothetical protein